MALQPPASGLRRFVNDSHDITRVELRVAPGAEIAVDDDTAGQLGPRFKDPDAVAARDAERGAERSALTTPAEPAKKSKKKAELAAEGDADPALGD